MKDSPTKTICFFNSNKAWGGGEKWHLTTAVEFKKRGYETMIATNEVSVIGEIGIAAGVPVYRFKVGNLSFLNPFKLWSLVQFFKEHKVDAVVLNLPSDLKAAGIAAKIAGIKKIIYRRGMPHPLRNTALNRFLFLNVLSDVVVNSKEIGRTLREGNESWFPDEKVTLVYNGVDTSRVLDPNRILIPRKENQLVIGSAGRLTDQKGQIYLIEMAAILKKNFDDFVVLIAGEGELKEELQRNIDENHLQEHVKLLGHVDDMEGFVNSIDVFVFPSKFEGSANTLIEVQQFGKPCIAFDVSSNPEIIENGQNGFLVAPFSSSDIAVLVTKILKMNDFVRNGKLKILEKFDSKICLDNFEKLIR